jgi:hypothetical protein
MNWKPATSADWHQLSGCGRYSVARIGCKSGQFFESWRTRKHEDGPHLISTNLPTSQAAREAAEEDDRGAA